MSSVISGMYKNKQTTFEHLILVQKLQIYTKIDKKQNRSFLKLLKNITKKNKKY